MLEELLKREDVLSFIVELKTNGRYFNKKNHIINSSIFYVSNEIALYVFYDALYKYQILFDDDSYFDEYLMQLERLYRKMDNIDDIRMGIHQLIAKMVASSLNLSHVNEMDNKKKLISYVYDRYIVDGYFIHGFPSSYYFDISGNGLVPEEYENYYDQFQIVNSIFEKYRYRNVIHKDFTSKKISFTDDFIEACYYSMYSPVFFYQFLTNEYFGKKIRKDYYLIDDYYNLMRYLKRFMNYHSFSERDKKYVLDVVEKEWRLLHRRDKRVSLLFVKRSYMGIKEVPLSTYLNSKDSTFEVVDRILSSKRGNVSYQKIIPSDRYKLMVLDDFCLNKKIVFNESKLFVRKKLVLGTTGVVSVLVLLGCLLISLGVIISIIMFWR